MRGALIKLRHWNNFLLLYSLFFSCGILRAQDGARPSAQKRVSFSAKDAFMVATSENLERVTLGKKVALRIERKREKALSSDDLWIDFEHETLFSNPAQQSLLRARQLERVDAPQFSGKAARFSLQEERLELTLPAYLNLSGNTATKEAGDFSFAADIEPTSPNATLLRRENFSLGTQYLFSLTLVNRRLVLRLENLLETIHNTKRVLESVTLESVDKVRTKHPNQILLTYSEAEGRLALYLNGKEQAVHEIRRASRDYYFVTFAPLKKAPLTLFTPFRGMVDNIVFTNRILTPDDTADFGKLTPYGDRYDHRQGFLLTQVFDMRFSRSTITAINTQAETNDENALSVEYRCHDRLFDARETSPLLSFSNASALQNAKCRFVQFRATFTADNSGRTTPLLYGISLEYRENPPPDRPAPPRIHSAKNGVLDLEIQPNTEMDVVNGGRYIVYYGDTKHNPQGAIYFTLMRGQGAIFHKGKLRFQINNETIAQNKKFADANPRFKNRFPVFEKGVGYYFWVTACDSAYDYSQERQDHESRPSKPVFARFE